MVGEIVQMSKDFSAGTFWLYSASGVAVAISSSAATLATSITLDIIMRSLSPTLSGCWWICAAYSNRFARDFVVHHAGGIDLSVHEGTFLGQS